MATDGIKVLAIGADAVAVVAAIAVGNDTMSRLVLLG